MPELMYHGYLRWLGTLWELHEAENLAFAYTVLRRR